MSTLIKIMVTSILSISLFSCNFNFGVRGNGNVITQERTIDGSFDHIEVSRALDVYLTQNETESLTVQADENLHDLIITKVEGNTLKVYFKENISYSEAKKVMINFINISKISATSGSDVYGTSIISSKDLELQLSSGGDMDLDVKIKNLNCKASSGGDLKVSGVADVLVVTASSGSDINTKSLRSVTANATASSGADIILNVSKELTAKAESGGDIIYAGNPEKINKSEGVSASINQQ